MINPFILRNLKKLDIMIGGGGGGGREVREVQKARKKIRKKGGMCAYFGSVRLNRGVRYLSNHNYATLF